MSHPNPNHTHPDDCLTKCDNCDADISMEDACEECAGEFERVVRGENGVERYCQSCADDLRVYRGMRGGSAE